MGLTNMRHMENLLGKKSKKAIAKMDP